MTDALRVVVAGGGIAGVEALLALHDVAGDRVQTTLVSPGPAFRFRPFAVAEPFGLGHPQELPYERLAADAGAEWVDAAVIGIDAGERTVRLADGGTLPYDALLLAAGAEPVPALEGAIHWSPDGARDILAGLLRDLEEGYTRNVAFVVGSGAVWPLPAYELALMTARDVHGMGIEAAVTVITPEPEPLAVFGEQASRIVAQTLADAGVQLVTGAKPGDTAGAARVVALPTLRGRPLEGVPADADGFIPVDDEGRVQGLENVYAAGDGVASEVKLGGLATRQARTAARAIARAAGAEVEDPGDEVVFDGVLMTGAAPVPLAGGQAQTAAAPVWWPARKVASRYLERYLAPDEPAQPPPGAGTELRLTSTELLSLGRRIREYETR